MLKTQAIFERKVNNFAATDCIIEKIVELSESEYKSFRTNLLRDSVFISENKEHMYMDRKGTYHCLLVLGENQPEGVLVESEGYDYARYASLLPGARDFVMARLGELADIIIREGTQDTSNGSFAIYFDEILGRYNVPVALNNGIGSMLLDILQSKPELAKIKPMEDGFDMAFYLDFCPNLDKESQEPAGIRKPRHELLERLIGCIGEHFSGQELYSIFHHTLKMSLNEMESMGFDLQAYSEAQMGTAMEQAEEEEQSPKMNM